MKLALLVGKDIISETARIGTNVMYIYVYIHIDTHTFICIYIYVYIYRDLYLFLGGAQLLPSTKSSIRVELTMPSPEPSSGLPQR